MLKLFITALLLSCLCLAALPEKGGAAQEFQEIKEEKNMSRMYDRAVIFFTQKIPSEFEYRLNNSYKYIDLIKAIFGEKGIPHEIAYLPFIESGFSPVSAGPGDAAGLWQFVRITAQKYGLKIDYYIDERRDPVKSTYAAAEYLGDLYSVFGKWDITLAAYNAGESKVRRIISRKGSGQLPATFNSYIARLLAVFEMAEAPEKYGFVSDGAAKNYAVNYREITTSISTSLEKIAAQNNTTVGAIRELNPALLRDETPPYYYVIKVSASY
jgi:membrane-bound lytic murein transglycosylase D